MTRLTYLEQDRALTRQMRREAVDWPYWFTVACVLSALVGGAVALHAARSVHIQ